MGNDCQVWELEVISVSLFRICGEKGSLTLHSIEVIQLDEMTKIFENLTEGKDRFLLEGLSKQGIANHE